LDILVAGAGGPDSGRLESGRRASADKAALPAGTERLLLKTSNSQLWERGENTFFTGFVAISEDGLIGWFDMHQVVGIDYLSVAPSTRAFQRTGPA